MATPRPRWCVGLSLFGAVVLSACAGGPTTHQAASPNPAVGGPAPVGPGGGGPVTAGPAGPAIAGPATGGTGGVTTPPPWPAPVTGVSALIAAAQMPPLPQESLVEHVHAHLDVFYDGRSVVVPADIGIDLEAERISPLHTHDTSGIIHIESPEVKPYYLGQFFTEWGVQMGGGCVAGQCAPARPVTVFVNGSPTQTPPEQVELKSHEEVALVIGTPPPSVPSQYKFSQGL